MTTTIQKRSRAAILLLAASMLVASDPGTGAPAEPAGEASLALVGAGAETVNVSGTAVHYFTTAIVHSQEPLDDGMIQRSTDIIELAGDLRGYVLYHPTSRFDFANQTLVNTGTQIFSGTILGSEPLVLHDDRYRFEVDLATGTVMGEVHLGRSRDAPARDGWYECDLSIVGTGTTPEGDVTSDYTGECVRRGREG